MMKTTSNTRRRVLLTGGLGSLGQAQARRLCADGADVCILDLPSLPGEAFVEDINANLGDKGGRAAFIPADLRDFETLQTLLRQTMDQSGGFDVLINNAALIAHKPFEDFTPEEYEEILRVNSTAGFLLTQLTAPHMKARQWGRIVNFCSLALNGRWPDYAPYAASKGAMLGQTKALARALGPFNVTVNAVSPGAIVSDAERRIFGDTLNEYNDWVLDNQSLKRRGQPEDVANLVAFLTGDEAGFLSGQILALDGGW